MTRLRGVTTAYRLYDVLIRGGAGQAETCIALVAAEGGRISGIYHTMSEDDVRSS